ncbi:uncharacterized protein LOC107646672 [Arachis ipaensis]|uniref:uncharacterized protein LOC107646672 n=1 Tax=Arachis ipaensis TaxID=130454 RepID=UPI0007AF46AB|nr:uncharacterized protein LOC107646672 [Arachis ipaensis]XP_025661289.1 uncharacterized protein LOC112756900 [Arachis hypogaea]
MEEVNYMGNPSRNSNNNLYSNSFNQGWRNHPNFGWRDQQKPQQSFNNNQDGMNQNKFNNRPFQPSQQQMETPTQSLSDLDTIVSNFSKATHSFMAETRYFIRNLEIQVGQLSKRIPEIPSNTLPSNTEVNPKEECKALTMEATTESKEEPATEKLKEIAAQVETGSVPLHTPMKIEKSDKYPSPNAQEEPDDKQLAQFLAVLRKLQVNISFVKVLEKNPPSMACLKSIIADKKALRGDKTMVLTKECSTLVQKKLPQKLLDPGSFLIHYTIGTITFEKALCDLGSSINLMPLSVMRKLGIQEVQPTMISLEMADKSLKRAYSMVENIFIKVEDLYRPADFVILDTGINRDDFIILGRPFLATAKALIDVEKGEIILRL